MADYASQIGGTDNVPGVDLAPSDGNWAYFFNEGDKVIDLGGGNDQFTGGHDNYSVFTGGGADTVTTHGGDDVVAGGGGADHINTGNGDDLVNPGDGNNLVFTGAGNDTVVGSDGSGDNTVDGGKGDNNISGGAGNDVLRAHSGDDTFLAGNGDDFVNGYAGNDYLVGGAGNDTLIGGRGDDTLTGGTGHDVFFFDSNFGHDVITDFNGAAGDQIWLKADLNNSHISSPVDVLQFVSGGSSHGVKYTIINIGGDTIKIQGVDVKDFQAHVSDWIKIQ
ncbi:MAG TPA: calcium-binding protein [Crenalkalicoccus sp.]|jgi:Ca2+-binding RTX toxin-like protein|nr:calcium-binding protein [Crenalkalicoccus sp.]